MNYTSRIDRVFAHGANVQGNQNLPGTNDPIINSDSGSLDASMGSGGITYSKEGNVMRRSTADDYTCQTLSPTPNTCGAMTEGVET